MIITRKTVMYQWQVISDIKQVSSDKKQESADSMQESGVK